MLSWTDSGLTDIPHREDGTPPVATLRLANQPVTLRTKHPTTSPGAGLHRRQRTLHHTAKPAPGTQLADIWILTKRIVMRLRRRPDVIVYSFIQPALFTLATVFVFAGAIKLPGGGSYAEFAICGMLAQTIVLATSHTACALALDIHDKVLDRLRILPVARSSILAGFTNAGLMHSLITVLITIGCGYLAGWRAHNGIGSAAAAIALLLLFGLAMSWLGALIGVSVSSPEAAAGAGSIWLFPFMYLSNALAPVQSMPVWVQYVAEYNPVSAIASACRQLFGNPAPPAVHQTLVTDHPIATSIVWSLAIIAAVMPLSIRKFMAAASR